MGKITFRADDDLVAELEAFDASKSEVMREALRTYLGRSDAEGSARTDRRATIDALVREHVADLIDDRLADRRDVSVTVSVDGVPTRRVDDRRRTPAASDTASPSDAAPTEPAPESASDTGSASDVAGPADESRCGQCGDPLDPDHVYCPNCGEKATRRLFCECGDEVRSDWSFCPGCGRRTPAADVLESG